MAMNEDSVVSSLNELRRMANDRAKREAESRARTDAEHNGRGSRRETRAWPADERNGNGYGDPSIQVQPDAYPPTLHQWQQSGQGGYGQGPTGYGHTAQPTTAW